MKDLKIWYDWAYRDGEEAASLTELRGLFQEHDNLLFFDTETTGFAAHGRDRITELAAVQIGRDGIIIREEDVFIQLPEGLTIPPQITQLTGITDAMCRSGITEAEAMERFLLMITSRTLIIAYNAQFDLNFIAQMCIRQKKTITADFLDPMTIFKDRRTFPHKLSDAIEAYELEEKVRNSHRAIDDVYALVEVTKAMALERDDLNGYVNLFGYNPKYGISGKRLKTIRYCEQPYHDGMCEPEETLPAISRA